MRCVAVLLAVLAFAMLAGCGQDKVSPPHAVADGSLIGILPVSGRRAHLDKGILGAAASADEPARAAAPARPTAPQIEVDTSTPEKTAEVFAAIMSAGQLGQLSSIVVEAQVQSVTELAAASTPLVEAMTHLKQQVSAKFPDAPSLSSVPTGPLNAAGGKITVSEVTPDSANAELASATLQLEGAPEPMKVTLHQQSGAWKVEMPSLDPEQVDQFKQLAPAMAEVIQGVAARVESGDISDAQQVGPELMKAIAGAAQGGGAAPAEGGNTDAAPAPAPQPAQPADTPKADRPKSGLEQDMENAEQRTRMGGI